MEENQSTSSKDSSNKKGIIIAVIAVIVILAIAGGGFLFLGKKEESSPAEMTEGANNTNTEEATQPSTQPSAMTSEAPSASGTAMTKSEYKDGTYTAVGGYQTHGGPESIAVKLTLANGVVTAVVVTEQPKDQMSKMMQEDFIANFKPMVVGKNIDSIKLGKVSGSSLTPMGFNAALETIKTQAKS